MQRALTRIAHEVVERNDSACNLVLVGVQRGGFYLAQRLAVILHGIGGQSIPVGALDVSMHRDDLGQQFAPQVHPTAIPFDITGKTVVLVDDVLFSGRTTRAALDALGRPALHSARLAFDHPVSGARLRFEAPLPADLIALLSVLRG